LVWLFYQIVISEILLSQDATSSSNYSIVILEIGFAFHIIPLTVLFFHFIRKHGINFHCCADQAQLYIASQPVENTNSSKLTECLKDKANYTA